MKLLSTQCDERSLFNLGEEACTMLLQRDYSGVANRFGYARAFDREAAKAIESDFLAAAASPFPVPQESERSIVVKYFKPNNTKLFAAVECMVPIATGVAIHLSLILTESGDQKRLSVEDIVGMSE